MHPLYIDRNGNFYSTPGADRLVIPAWFGVINPPENLLGGDYTLTLDTTPDYSPESTKVMVSLYTCQWIGGVSELLRFRLARLLLAARDERIAAAALRAADHDLRQQSRRLELFAEGVIQSGFAD